MTRVPEISVAPAPIAPPLIPPETVGRPHEYRVPAGTTPLVTFAGEDVNVPPLHIVAVMADIAGFGLTVTVTVKGEPVQLPDFGVTVYIACPAAFVELISVPLMFAELLPEAPPEIPPLIVGAGQLYEISAGIIPSVPSTGIVVKVPSLHIAAVRLFTAGIGFTVIVTVKSEPVHGPDTGVTV